MYEKLKTKLAANKIRQREIARVLGITEHSLCSKLNGKTPFYLREAKKLRDVFFPTETIEALFELQK